MSEAKRISDGLGGKRSGDEYIASCPAHDDKNPSLSISDKPDGGVLVHCHAGCGQDDVIEELRSRGLWSVKRRQQTEMDGEFERLISVSEDPTTQQIDDALGFHPDQMYPYRTTGGELMGYVARKNHQGGKKDIRPVTPWRSPDGGIAWRQKALAEPRPLYGQELLALHPQRQVVIVEGEKTVDAARLLFPDYLIITWPSGSKALGRANWLPLKGRVVILWPDADDPGRKAMDELSGVLVKIGGRAIKRVQVPKTLPKGWDLADPAPIDFDPERVLREATEADHTLVPYLMTASSLRAHDIPPRQYIIDPFLPEAGLAMVFAKRGVGKTWFALVLALSIARGEDFLVYGTCGARTVLYIDGEMALQDLKDRLVSLNGPETDNLILLPSEVLFREKIPLNINLLEHQTLIVETLHKLEAQNRRPSLIILDNLSSLGGGIDENDNSALEEQLKWLVGLRHMGYAVLIVHHAGKTGDQRGASRREDLLDTSIKLGVVDDDEAANVEGAKFDLEFVKTRGRMPQPATMRLALHENDEGSLEFQIGASGKKSSKVGTLYMVLAGVKQGEPPKEWHRPFLNQAELVKALGVAKGTVSRHLKPLREAGWVVTEGKLLVTPEGVEKLREHYADVDQHTDKPTIFLGEQLRSAI